MCLKVLLLRVLVVTVAPWPTQLNPTLLITHLKLSILTLCDMQSSTHFKLNGSLTVAINLGHMLQSILCKISFAFCSIVLV